MSSSDNNDGPFYVIGACLLMLFFASILIKALKQFFIELGQSFEAFGNMTGSFISMLWNVFQVVALVSMTIAGVICAVYFTIKYFEMVKDGIAIRESVQKSLEGFEAKLNDKMAELENQVNRQVLALDAKLTKALAKPEVAPKTTAVPSNEQAPPANNDSQPDEVSTPQASQENETTSSDSTDVVAMSNPY